MAGSDELRRLYLDPADAGVPWLLDPARSAGAFRVDCPCDADALAGDLDDVLVLLRERHIGLATGSVSDGGVDEWAAAWRDRLLAERPTTWGAAVGLDLRRLRLLLGDAHLSVAGETAVDPRRNRPTVDDRDGPPIEEHVVDGVLCLRIRRFFERPGEQGALRAWQEAHGRHFAYDRIVVDLRGNPGGSDTYSWEWIAPHVPTETECYPAAEVWLLDGKRLAAWNQIVRLEALGNPVRQELYADQPRPRPGARLHMDRETGVLPAGPEPWHGDLTVLVDHNTASAGESTAWMLRQAFGAKLVGTSTASALTYGDLAPYLLPRSGLELMLPTIQFDVPSYELGGIPVDVERDPRVPLAAFVKGQR